MTSTAPYDVDFGIAPDDLRYSLLLDAKRKAGLAGRYLDAECDLGEELVSMLDSGRGAYLFGKPGRGKTYAAAHAVRVAVERGFERGKARGAAKLVTTKRLLDDIRSGYDGGDRDAIERAEGVGLLVLDDFGAERLTDWAIETLTRILDTRSFAGLPVIVTSNYPLGALRDVWGEVPGARVASRIGGMCEVREVTGDDRRLA